MAGGDVVVISKDAASDLREFAALEGYGFTLLSDPNLELVDAFGLRHEGADPHGGDLARPAVLFFDRSGRLRDAFLTENWRIRLTSEKALAHVRALAR